MNYITRAINIEEILRNRSLFLFGPRQTGKSTYIRNELNIPSERFYNLLDNRILFRVMADPSIIRQEIEARDLSNCVVCIDEIQKCPQLLDEVHLLIEERNLRFLLTGSSARKIKKGGTNLLGGRASFRNFHPFVFPEIRETEFSLERVLYNGLLPPHYLSDNPGEGTRSYVDLYLKEEIAAEGLARNLPAFSRFLQIASASNTRIINYTNIGSDAGVPRQTVKQWFQILLDTLLGFELRPFTKTVKRKALETAKFYFFDTGVVRILRQLKEISPASADFGEFFEQYIFLELRAYLDYRRPGSFLYYWRSTSGFEVDFFIDGEIAIEVKAAEIIHDKHMKGLKALREEGMSKRSIIVCREKSPRKKDGIEIFPWKMFLEHLWDGRIV